MASTATSPRPEGLARLAIALAAVTALLALELVAALLSHSLALLGDSGHLLTDVASLGIAAWAVRRSRRPASAAHTFGHHRTGILVAAVNGLLLLAIAVALAAGAVGRLAHPVEVHAAAVVVVAAVALVVNSSLAIVLNGAGDELSVRSALLHVLADGVANLGVLVSGVIILTAGWLPADPLASLLIALLIAAGAIRLLRETGEILGERAPRGVDAAAIGDLIAAVDGVEGVHDLHVWSLSRRHRALSAHVAVGDVPMAQITAVLRDVETALCGRFGIEHVTLQPECPACNADAPLWCDLDERHALHEPGQTAKA